MQTLKEQSKESQIIIITGGLGPTADDITKPSLCEFFGAKLKTDESVLQNIKSIFEKIRKNTPNMNVMLDIGWQRGN